MLAKVNTKGLELLRRFGFTTNAKDYKRSKVYEDYLAEKISILSLDDAAAKEFYMESMNGYHDLFARGVACTYCSEPIILPIDLRRHHGTNYHGYCFINRIKDELGAAVRTILSSKFKKLDLSKPDMVTSDPYDLECLLKIARVCCPRFGNTFDKGLSEFELIDVAGIKTRPELENWYWTGMKD